MHKRTVIVVLGVLVALSPFIGLPYVALMWILPVLGIIIAVLAYPFRRRQVPEEPAEPVHEAPTGF